MSSAFILMDYHPGLHSFVIPLIDEKTWNRLYFKGMCDTFYCHSAYVQITFAITPDVSDMMDVIVL